MVKFLLWCILLVLCWPLALMALISTLRLAPAPAFSWSDRRGRVFELIKALFFLPARCWGRAVIQAEAGS